MNIRKRRLHSQTEVLGFKNETRLTRPLRPMPARTSQEASPPPPQPSGSPRPPPPPTPPPARFWSAASTISHHAGMLSEPKVHRLCRGIERGAYVASLESVSDPANVTGGHAWHAAGHGCLARTNRNAVLASQSNQRALRKRSSQVKLEFECERNVGESAEAAEQLCGNTRSETNNATNHSFAVASCASERSVQSES